MSPFKKKEKSIRESTEVLVLTLLNSHRDQERIYNAYVDCGELGLLHVWWPSDKWLSEWIEVKKLSDLVEGVR